MPETILVCGGAGYIGSHVVRAILRGGMAAVVVDDLSTGHRRSLPPGVELVEASVGDRAAMTAVLKRCRPSVVMHFCANAYVGESVENPRKYYHNNIVNGLALLDAMLEAGCGRLVFSSSCTVYGHPQRVPVDELCELRPISPYGRTKAMFEQVLADYGHAHGLRWAALRYFNASGAALDGSIGEDHDPETHLIPLVLRKALEAAGRLRAQGPLKVFGNDYDTPDGTCIRDYIHVLDLAEAHIAAAAALAGGGESMAVNLANQRGFSVLEVIAECQRATGATIPYEFAPRRPGDPAALVGSAELARRKLGWTAKHSDLATIVASAWRWHQMHPAGYASQG